MRRNEKAVQLCCRCCGAWCVAVLEFFGFLFAAAAQPLRVHACGSGTLNLREFLTVQRLCTANAMPRMKSQAIVHGASVRKRQSWTLQHIYSDAAGFFLCFRLFDSPLFLSTSTIFAPPPIAIIMRTFCCCIPVRLGVCILAPVTAVGAALLAYTQLYLLINFQAQYDTFEKAIRGALAGITILLGLASLFGFLGAIFARRAMVSFYSNMLWICLLVFTVLGALNLWQLFAHKDSIITACENRAELKTQDLQSFFGISFQGQTDKACKKVADTSAIVVAVLFGILVLILMWLIGIVTKYKHQLQERDAAYAGHWDKRRSHRFGNIGKSRSGYHPASDMDETGAANASKPYAAYERA